MTPPETEDIGDNRTELVQAIYQIAVDPSAYDPLIEHWGKFLLSNFETSDFEEQAEFPVSKEISGHLLRVLEILDRLGRTEQSDTVFNEQRPEIILTATGRIKRCNALAASVLGCAKDDSVYQMSLSPESRHRMKECLGAIGRPGVEDIFIFFEDKNGLPCPMVRQIDQDARWPDCMVLSGLKKQWTAEHDHILQNLFGLTQAETRLAGRILDGSSLRDVAEETGRSIDTLRTQLKSIRRKTYTTNQQQLVRIMTGLENLSHTRAAGSRHPNDTSHTLTLKNGRALSYRFFGAEDGRPCLFIHNMLSDPRFTDDVISVLRSNNLKFICPIRPSFGNSDPDPTCVATPDRAPDRFANDAKELLDHLGIEKTVVIGNMSGAVFSFCLAQKFPDLVAGLVNISGAVPLRELSQIASMNTRQKVIALTARLTPRLLTPMLRAGIAQIDSGGVDSFLTALFRNGSPDQKLIEDVDIQNVLYEGFRQIVKQGHMAFAIDSHHVVRNWTSYCTDLRIPVCLLHGEQDPVVSAKSVRNFALKMDFDSHIFHDAGQLILFDRPAETLGRIKEIADLSF